MYCLVAGSRGNLQGPTKKSWIWYCSRKPWLENKGRLSGIRANAHFSCYCEAFPWANGNVRDLIQDSILAQVSKGLCIVTAHSRFLKSPLLITKKLKLHFPVSPAPPPSSRLGPKPPGNFSAIQWVATTSSPVRSEPQLWGGSPRSNSVFLWYFISAL